MKFTSVAPAYCAACYQHDATIRHVDFEGSYDGPVLMLEDGRKQPIDDLVLCEKCLVAAFSLLDPENLQAEARAARMAKRNAEIELHEREKEIVKLKEALEVKVREPGRRPISAEAVEAGRKNLEKARKARERIQKEKV